MKISDKLAQAIDLLADYAKRHLPPDFELTLSFRNNGVWFELRHDDYDAIQMDSESFVDACKTAKKHDNEWGGS